MFNDSDGKGGINQEFKNISNNPEVEAGSGYIGNKLMSSIGSIWGTNA
jgi:hypothetical protein